MDDEEYFDLRINREQLMLLRSGVQSLEGVPHTRSDNLALSFSHSELLRLDDTLHLDNMAPGGVTNDLRPD